MERIKIAIVGVGNCASSLVQGVHYYRKQGEDDAIGLMHWDLGGYLPSDVEVVAAFDGAEEMVIALAPEGTRSHTTHWKTGFYYIALGANVPIILAFIDYPTKRIGLGSILYPTGDLDADMQLIRDFYADKRGKKPENKGEIRALPPGEE